MNDTDQIFNAVKELLKAKLTLERTGNDAAALIAMDITPILVKLDLLEKRINARAMAALESPTVSGPEMTLPASTHIAQAVLECRKLALKTKDAMLRARIQTYGEMLQTIVRRVELLEKEIEAS